MPEQSRGAPPPGLLGSQAVDQAFCGIGAGCVSVVCMHPLDLLKVKFQVATTTAPQGRGLGIIRGWKDIIGRDGWRGLYRGLSPNLVGNAASWGFYFLGYSHLKTKLAMQPDGTLRRLSAPEHLACAATSGVWSTVLTNPLWVVKTRMFTSRARSEGAYRSVLDGLARVAREEGVRGLWRGTTLAVVGVSNGAVQFMTYEELKKWRRDFHAQRQVKREGSAMRGTNQIPVDETTLSNLEYIVLSGMAKLVAIGLTYPYQVVRSRMQNQTACRGVQNNSLGSTTGSSGSALPQGVTYYRSIPHCISHTYNTEGPRAFYKGLAPNAVRVLPGTCVTFVVYENLSAWMKSAAEDKAKRGKGGTEFDSTIQVE